MSDLTYYGFKKAIGGYFEYPSAEIKKMLPSHLQPVELMPAVGIFSVIIFEFTDSSVGSYNEAVVSFMVQPFVNKGEPMPHAAFFPLTVATNTAASKNHANERWNLPGWSDMMDIQVNATENGYEGIVADLQNNTLLKLNVVKSVEAGNPNNIFQSFMEENDENYMVTITVEGSTIEHEEGDGGLVINPHDFFQGIDLDEIEKEPFREIIIEDGRQIFQPLIKL